VYRTAGRDTGVAAELSLGTRSAAVALLDVSARCASWGAGWRRGGGRLSTSFVVDRETRGALDARLRRALNERGAIRVRPPEDIPVRVEVDLPARARTPGRLVDASVVGLGVHVRVRRPPAAVVGSSVRLRIWLPDQRPVALQAAAVRVAPVLDARLEPEPGVALMGLVSAPNGEAACPAGIAIGRWVVRARLAGGGRR
jgi:hypothetical protein